MSLSSDLISQFVKVTKDSTKAKVETTRYGTIVKDGDKTYVRLDGSELLTPVATTTDAESDERVTVTIENHTAIVTGNVSSPSARTDSVKEVGNKISEFEVVIADKVSTGELEAELAKIDKLIADKASIEDLEAERARIDELVAEDVDITGRLTAAEGNITKLEAEKLNAEFADITYATIENLEALHADVYDLEATYGDFAVLTAGRLDAIDATIGELDAGKISAEQADLRYANIDFSNIGEAAIENFYSKSGLIEDLVVGDGTITGQLVGVTIKGDLIEGGTIVADKLVVKGDDGLYYKLNTDGVKTEAEQTDYNSLNGSVITAQSITATKISVDDLVAFDATIGGFNIADHSIYSGVKNTVDNGTRGVYLDDEGQVAFGDTNNYIKYYKDTDGSYRLAISAGSIVFAASKKNVEEALEEIDDLEIGGRNLLRATNTEGSLEYISSNSIIYPFQTSFENGVVVFTSDEFDNGCISYTFDSQTGLLQPGSSYVASFDIMLDKDAKIAVDITSGYDRTEYAPIVDATPLCIANEWTHVVAHLTTVDVFSADIESDHPDLNIYLCQVVLTSARLKNLKLEKGDKPTAWTPAIEDMAMSEDVDEVKTAVESTGSRISIAETLIQQLSDCISMLVTDGNGSSLMTQTEDGWTFSIAEIQSAIDDTSESLDNLTNEVGDVSGTVDVLEQAVSDLGQLAEYVKITIYEDEPCIELGEGDSDFKLLITNTRIMFKEGSNVPAYINNQSLYINKAVVEEELQQGGFAWKVRANGNLGLIWKGVSE